MHGRERGGKNRYSNLCIGFFSSFFSALWSFLYIFILCICSFSLFEMLSNILFFLLPFVLSLSFTAVISDIIRRSFRKQHIIGTYFLFLFVTFFHSNLRNGFSISLSLSWFYFLFFILFFFCGSNIYFHSPIECALKSIKKDEENEMNC